MESGFDLITNKWGLEICELWRWVFRGIIGSTRAAQRSAEMLLQLGARTSTDDYCVCCVFFCLQKWGSLSSLYPQNGTISLSLSLSKVNSPHTQSLMASLLKRAPL